MLKSFQIHAIQQALVTAGLHYHLPTGIWDNDTLQSYQQFHAVSLFQPNVHLLQQPNCITSVCSELLHLAGLIINGKIVDHDDNTEEGDDAEDPDEPTGEGDAEDPADLIEEDSASDDEDPADLNTHLDPAGEGSVIFPDGVSTVNDLQSQNVDPNFQLNASEIAAINGFQPAPVVEVVEQEAPVEAPVEEQAAVEPEQEGGPAPEEHADEEHADEAPVDEVVAEEADHEQTSAVADEAPVEHAADEAEKTE